MVETAVKRRHELAQKDTSKISYLLTEDHKNAHLVRLVNEAAIARGINVVLELHAQPHVVVLIDSRQLTLVSALGT